jgi:hypothetical protein
MDKKRGQAGGGGRAIRSQQKSRGQGLPIVKLRKITEVTYL